MDFRQSRFPIVAVADVRPRTESLAAFGNANAEFVRLRAFIRWEAVAGLTAGSTPVRRKSCLARPH